MLRSLKALERYTLSATDGDIGKVENFFLDDERWIVRYLVAETGGLFEERRVLISPISFRAASWSTRRLFLALTKQGVRRSPTIDLSQPVSRRHERAHARYYGYPYYWGYPGLWGMGAYPGWLATGRWTEPAIEPAQDLDDVHLQNVRDLHGYHIQGNDELIGHVEDFIVDDESWEIRYLAVDTSNWWIGKKVLVSPHWATGVNWGSRKIYIDLSRQAVKSSPEWDPSTPVNRAFEERLYDYYGRPSYWGGGDDTLGTWTPHRSETHSPR